MKSTILNKMENMVNNNSDLAFLAGQLKPDAELIQLGVNSLIFIKLVVAIETEFDIEFDDEDLEMNSLLTVQDFVDYIDNKLRK